mmetsp:Transcript_15066/g.30595  ORF Transcript_15066/g.30595 Transcript_15066/m.30595 type:complete len:112 (+) Transcript_15066:177-512(+)
MTLPKWTCVGVMAAATIAAFLVARSPENHMGFFSCLIMTSILLTHGMDENTPILAIPTYWIIFHFLSETSLVPATELWYWVANRSALVIVQALVITALSIAASAWIGRMNL